MSQAHGTDAPAPSPLDAPEWTRRDLPDLRLHTREAHGRTVAVVEFDLPERRNSMSEAMTASWVEVMGELAEDDDLACVVVTGRGPGFNAGGDLSWIVGEPDATVARLRRRMIAFYRQWLTVKRLEVPTIAAINGHAIGAGLALALACDIRYVSDSARLGVPFTHLGLHPGMASTWSLPEVAGLAVARDLLLTGRIVTGAEAVGLGLASWSGPAGEVLAEALAAADRVASSAPLASRWTTAALRDGGHASFEDAIAWEGLAQAVTMTTADLREGIAAAKEKRAARFTGE